MFALITLICVWAGTIGLFSNFDFIHISSATDNTDSLFRNLFSAFPSTVEYKQSIGAHSSWLDTEQIKQRKGHYACESEKRTSAFSHGRVFARTFGKGDFGKDVIYVLPVVHLR